MKHSWLAIIILAIITWSCQKDEAKLKLEQEKEAKKRELIFANIDKNWTFSGQAINVTSQTLTQSWAEWRVFLKELSQKPKSSIGAFQKKAKTLSKRALELNNNIPVAYNKPEVRSRISAIITKANSLNLYINLNNIPDDKVAKIIPEINQEVQALQLQLAEIDQISRIKMEDGEEDMIKMLDTARAISVEKAPINASQAPISPVNNPNITKRKKLLPTPLSK